MLNSYLSSACYKFEELASRHIFHNDKDIGLSIEDLIQPNDVGMIEVAKKLNFPLDFRAHLRRLHLFLVHDLYGDLASRIFVPRH